MPNKHDAPVKPSEDRRSYRRWYYFNIEKPRRLRESMARKLKNRPSDEELGFRAITRILNRLGKTVDDYLEWRGRTGS